MILPLLIFPFVKEGALKAQDAIPPLPVEIKLGPGGEIEGWLIAKEPKTPYVAEGGEWKFAYVPPDRDLDLRALLGGEHTYGFAGTTLVSDRPRHVALLFGTDDGGTLTVNGKEVWRKAIVRGVKRDEERVELDLKAGANPLVFRIDQGVGGWGLVARLADAAGVASRTDLLMEGSYPEIRMARHLPGAFDADLAERYVALDRTARRWDERIGGGAVFRNLPLRQPAGFGSAEDLNALNRDHLKVLDGAFRRVRAPFVARAQNPGPLFPNVAPEPPIAVLPGGRAFLAADGKPYVPIGYNHNLDWTELEKANPLADDYDPNAADRWFAKLAANGVNLVRTMVETPPSGNLEEKVGTFRYEHMLWLDRVVAAARKSGVRLMLTPYDTFWMNVRQETSPYWEANGGPLGYKPGWYEKPELRAAHKRRLRWLIDRYGNLGTVFAWEPMNEVDLWWDAPPATIGRWADDVVEDARAYQRKRWGVARLFTLSIADPLPRGPLADLAFRRPDLDIANVHLYIGASRDPREPWVAVPTEAEGVRHALSEVRDGRPFMDTENGPIDRWVPDPKLDDAVFHDQSWSHLASGGAGSGLRWPYRGPHHLSDGMLAHLKAMRRFCDSVDWRALSGAWSPVPVSGERIVGTGYRAGEHGMAFAARKGKLGAAMAGEIRVAVPNAGSGRVWNAEAGRWLGRADAGGFVLPNSVRSATLVW